MRKAPVADHAMIKRTLETLFEPGHVVELRAFQHRRNTVSGYFDDLVAAERDAVKLNQKCGNVYMMLNQLDPALLARRVNRLEEYADSTTTDTQVVRRRWLPVDLDPVRPSGISATDVQHEAALQVSRRVYGFLVQEMGFPRPIVGDSGNGCHLLFRVDLPNDDTATHLVQDCLRALADRFDNTEVTVDVGNFNAARIWKVYGTVATKGDHTPERPHRLARLLHVPDVVQVVSVRQLQQLANLAPASSVSLDRADCGFDVGQWLEKHGVDVLYVDPHYGGRLGPGRKWVLTQCPWNPEHADKSAFVIQFDAGPIVAGCHHNGCVGRGWTELREAVEKPDEAVSTVFSHTSQHPPTDLLSQTSLLSQWPSEIDSAALHGLAGDVVRTIAPHTEADPVAILLQFLTAFGNAAGRSAHFMAESDRHFLKSFVVLVGATSKGRKGTSWGHVRRLFQGADPAWVEHHIASGLASGEGIIWAVRDQILTTEKVKNDGQTVDVREIISDRGVMDKRLLCLEAEFASLLKTADRHGNTLSPVIRNAWDSGNLQTVSKNSPAKATGAHISLIGHITADELRRYLTSTEVGNGFGNRFLWLCVRRSQLLPEGGSLTDEHLQPLIERLREALEAARWIEDMKRDNTSTELWKAIYPELSREIPGIYGALTSRSEAQVMRLACIYAALDSSCIIRRPHLEAAVAVWEYVAQSVQCIFGEATGDPLADALEQALLERSNGMTRSEIRDLLGRHGKTQQVTMALELLKQLGRVHFVHQKTGGRPRETWIHARHATKAMLATKG